jgi:hypothetical protein
MTKRTGWLLMLIAESFIGVSVGAAGDRVNTAGQADVPLARIRATTAQLTALLRAGPARSKTFRALVDRLERSEVLVYIEPGRCRPNDPVRLTGCLIFLGSSGGLRVFRIIVDVGGPERSLIATIGHELHHAVEVVVAGMAAPGDEPPGIEVRKGVYETEAAREVTRAILAELGRSVRGGVARRAAVIGELGPDRVRRSARGRSLAQSARATA